MIDAVRRAQGGDHAAFHALYRAHVGRVYAVCLRFAGNRPEAEELTQNVFVRAWEKLESFRGESAFATWLHRLAINESIGARRSLSRREQRVKSVEDPAASERPIQLTPSPGDVMDLDRAMARLPAGARQVFILHDIEGYEHQEIAKLTGVAAGTSKAQLHRARRLLREALQR
jgi:RNA polymerase sigma-70 factor (ECF subfamily)